MMILMIIVTIIVGQIIITILIKVFAIMIKI